MLQSGGQILTEEQHDRIIFKIRGEIDHHSAVSVRTGIDAEISDKRPKKVCLELSGVDFMDSSGLGLIMGRYALMKQYGGEFSVLNPSPAVMKMIHLAGMEKMIQVEKSMKKGETK